MATPVPKTSRLNRDDFVRILDLPPKEFRAAKAAMTESEIGEMRQVWLEESRAAFDDYNRYVEEHGIPFAEYRQF